MSSYLDLDHRDGVLTATFRRPTWNLSQEREVIDLFQGLRVDADVRALVLTGRGKVFCRGASHVDDPFDAPSYHRRYSSLFETILDVEIPIVVGINGAISGMGLSLALLADVTYLERHVYIQDHHVTGGVVSATGAFLWPPAVGVLRSKRYLLTGDKLSAEQAAEMGLVTEVVDTGTAAEHARAMALRLASAPPDGVRGTKRAINRWLRGSMDAILGAALADEFMAMPAELAATFGKGA